MDFGTGTTGAGIAHFPEIIFFIAVDDTVGRQELFPDGSSFIVATEPFGRRSFKNGYIEPVFVELQHIGKVFPGPFDGFFFEVIAKRPVAEHLEHGMVVGVVAYFFEVVVLATHPQAFLRIGHPGVLHWVVAKDNVFKLIHARVGKHQGGVILDNHGGRRYNFMIFGSKKIEKRLAYFL